MTPLGEEPPLEEDADVPVDEEELDGNGRKEELDSTGFEEEEPIVLSEEEDTGCLDELDPGEDGGGVAEELDGAVPSKHAGQVSRDITVELIAPSAVIESLTMDI
jgi:hypothetical protein